MHVRTMYSKYIARADAFFEKLMPQMTDLQFTSNGPIIAVQVENEYGAFGYGDHPRDTAYLQHLMEKMKDLGIREMFFTSDSPDSSHDWGSVPGGKLLLAMIMLLSVPRHTINYTTFNINKSLGIN